MPTAYASCDRCGNVDLGDIREVTVRRCADNCQYDYRFRCPICAMFIVRPLYLGAVHPLIQAGARVEHWRLPREIFERPGAEIPNICADDLIDFHAALDRLPTAGNV